MDIESEVESEVEKKVDFHGGREKRNLAYRETRYNFWNSVQFYIFIPILKGDMKWK